MILTKRKENVNDYERHDNGNAQACATLLGSPHSQFQAHSASVCLRKGHGCRRHGELAG